MKLRARLFDESMTLGQQLIVLLWAALIVVTLAVWLPNGIELIKSGVGDVLLGIAQLLGLFATFFALTQFMLMGRIGWIERQFGLDRLARFHRLNGYLAITFIVLHPFFITISRVVLEEIDFRTAYFSTLTDYSFVVLALIAEILFVAVVFSSIYIARKRLKFEIWYFVHLMVYAAIVLASLHQFTNGGTLLSSDIARFYWFGLYGFVALNLIVWRFGMPVYNLFRFRFEVSRVVRETPTVTSVYIRANRLSRLKVKPGQFVLVRILAKNLWWQEHPFTVSWIPANDELRISVRAVGDYTKDIQNLKPGAKVVVSGPFGRFTNDVAVTKKRLFIAGGIGITPLRSLAEQSVQKGINSVILYGNKDSHDVPLKSEIEQLGLKMFYVYSDEVVPGAEHGYIDGKIIERLVPDYRERDIFICGPPSMMMGIIAALHERQVPPRQVHFENFSLHN